MQTPIRADLVYPEWKQKCPLRKWEKSFIECKCSEETILVSLYMTRDRHVQERTKGEVLVKGRMSYEQDRGIGEKVVRKTLRKQPLLNCS